MGVTEAPDVVRGNIDRVLTIEAHIGRPRGFTETTSDFVGRFVGSFAFVAFHLVLLGVWVTLNSHAVPSIRPWDPYPFGLLSTLTSTEAVIVAAFVLITQNRMAKLADRRDHLDLQVNLMAEQEASMIIQMLDRISRKLGLPADEREAALELSRTCTLENLVAELHERFPDSEGTLPKDLPPPG